MYKPWPRFVHKPNCRIRSWMIVGFCCVSPLLFDTDSQWNPDLPYYIWEHFCSQIPYKSTINTPSSDEAPELAGVQRSRVCTQYKLEAFVLQWRCELQMGCFCSPVNLVYFRRDFRTLTKSLVRMIIKQPTLTKQSRVLKLVQSTPLSKKSFVNQVYRRTVLLKESLWNLMPTLCRLEHLRISICM